MKISGVNSAGIGGPAGTGMGEDAETKSIRNEIARVQKKLQDLAANENISLEEKMKKRQELQKQLADLNSQLKQHEIEQRKKASEAGKKQENELDSLGRKHDKKKQEDPAAEVILTADAALKQAKTQDQVITKQKGRAGVLKIEIQQDSNRGRNVEAKQEELADIEGRMAEARSSQMEHLNHANQAIKEENEDGAAQKTEEVEEKEEVREDGTKGQEAEKESEQESIHYRPINILL